jgi:formylglycine-generating enzyme required for sulfatase activity/Tfp pilus assembly protein PilF
MLAFWGAVPSRWCVSRIFVSHSSDNNAQAIALSRWLEQEGWNDIFLDLDPERGIKAGERWEDALRDAADRCEAVLFLVSRAWLASEWCRDEFRLARHLRKRLFGILVEDIVTDDLPPMLTREWQVVNIAPAGDTKTFSVTVPQTAEPVQIAFSVEGLRRLRLGLFSAGLDASYFSWPPENDPDRPPYRGLLPLEAEDAGIFFGREGPIIEAIDALRGLRGSAPPRLLVILGASGSGKSSFLRAGLFPRLKRDDRNFLPLPVIRPEQAAISGDNGLLSALEEALYALGIATTRAKLRAAVEGGVTMLRPLLQTLLGKAVPRAPDAGIKPAPPTLILFIDQGEELFGAEGQDEAQALLGLLWDLLLADAPAVIVVFAIRSDSYAHLQEAKSLEGIRKLPFDLGPMPKGSYAELIKGPARRLEGTKRRLEIEDALVDTLLADIEAGGAKDALPLLAFTLERLYVEHGGDGDMTVAEYRSLGGIRGSIEAAVERALKAADADPAIPRDRAARLALLRRGLIPWLAGIDPDTGAPRRRVARFSEIPAEARPLIQHLLGQRLLATDVNKETGEATIEPAHEALLRQWGLLEGWLTEDAGLLAVLEGVKRASRDWEANDRSRAWLSHQTDRLAAAQRLSARPDLATNLDPTDRAYIAACRKAETDAKRGRRLLQGAIYVSLATIILVLVGVIKQDFLKAQWNWWTVERPYAAAQVWPHVLTAAQEQALKQGNSFQECAQDCPEMVVVAAGSFIMGASAAESHAQNYGNDLPQHTVTIAKPFAVSKYELTFADWDACVAGGGCKGYKPNDQGWGRGQQPVINVSWQDAQTYVKWLSQVTGKTYRLLSEAEYEYATRAGTTTVYPWGDDIKLDGQAMANCYGCGGKWDDSQTAPVGSFRPNKFALYDMVGNVNEWTEDCFHNTYDGAPTNGLAWTAGGNCDIRIARGGAWINAPEFLWSADRNAFNQGGRNNLIGFRVARTLDVTLTQQQIEQIEQEWIQQQKNWCRNENNAFSADVQIAACTGMVQSGKSDGKDLAWAYLDRGIAYRAKGDLDHAIADYSEAIKLDPKDAVAYVNRGVAYRAKGDLDHAIADYSEAIKLDPKDAVAYYARGNAYEAKNDFDHAIADYSEAIQLDPKVANAYNARCFARAIVGRDLQIALADCNEALRLKPNDSDTLNSRGLVQYKLGAFQQAIVDYSAAIAQNPKDANSLYGRGLAKLKIGDTTGNADIAAAKAIEPDITKVFAGYGVN